MGSNISLFSGYNASENRTTNYCLLILKMIYEENPKYLGGILSSLAGENLGDLVGVKFQQQEKRKASIPDGLILQKSFTIYIETKNYDWFYDDQLESHLDALSEESRGLKILIALGAFDFLTEERFARIDKLCRTKYESKIFFTAISFEDFIASLSSLSPISKNLSDMFLDFRDYLDQEGLLPIWQRILDVVNCAGLPEDVLEGNVYMCPAEGGAYAHQRSKYFGMYRNKAVERIGVIEAVVDIQSNEVAILKWKNVDKPDDELKQIARRKHAEWRPDDYPTRVFVLGALEHTNFFKESKGGMINSKRYFDVGLLEPEDAKDLADKLDGVAWPENEWIVRTK